MLRALKVGYMKKLKCLFESWDNWLNGDQQMCMLWLCVFEQINI